MRLALLAATATACGGPAIAPGAPAVPVDVSVLRWVPAQPTYVIASPTLADGQRQLRGLVDMAGTLAGFDLRDAAAAVSDLIAVDALDADPVAAIGVDPAAGWVAFSDALSPTLVVHLAAPEAMTAFLERLRERGLATQSIVVAGTEVVSAALGRGVVVSWAIAGDWMWVHFAPPFAHEDATAWFAASHAPHAAAWAGDWAWAQGAAGAAAGLVGMFRPRGPLADLAGKLPDAVACARLVASVGRVALAVDADDHHVAVRIAIDVGSTAGISPLIVAPPPGWAAASSRAALAVQWNLDLTAAPLARCLAVAGVDVAALAGSGVRTARGIVVELDPDALSGTGAVAFDVTSPALFARQLDRIPLRRTLERARRFGPYHGASIAIPFGPTIEYVLDDHRAIAALGEGLLDRLLAGPDAAHPAPLFALEIAPPALSAQAWAAVLHLLAEHELSRAPSGTARRTAERLLQWRHGHLAVTIEPTALVVALDGERR